MLQDSTVPTSVNEITSQSLPRCCTTCETVTPANVAGWNEALDAIDESTRFLCSDWTRILKETYHYSPQLVVLKQEGQIKSVLPYVVVSSPITGKRAVSLPFFDICKAFSLDESLIPKLHEKLKKEGKENGWDYIELRGDIQNLEKTPSSLSFYNHVVDLRPGPDAVFDNLSSSNRRAIRKSQKDGVQIKFSRSLESLRGFYKLQCITRKRHGLPSQPFKFFEAIHRNLIAKNKGVIVSALLKSGELAACAIYLEQGNTVHYKYGASDKDFQSHRSNNLVMWSALRRYSELGFDSIDLGRNSITNSGLRRYKLSWGPTESIVNYHRYDLKKNVTIPMNDDVFGWHNDVFKRLPNPILKLAGRLLYRHIA